MKKNSSIKKQKIKNKLKPNLSKNASNGDSSKPVQYFTQEYLASVASTTPTQRLEFLESFRKMQETQHSSSTLISLRIPDNLLHAFKIKAESKGIKYQTLIKKLMADFL